LSLVTAARDEPGWNLELARNPRSGALVGAFDGKPDAATIAPDCVRFAGGLRRRQSTH
jgi:hypothetical protein